MEYFHIVISQIIIFVIYALLGVTAVKTNILNETGLVPGWLLRLHCRL